MKYMEVPPHTILEETHVRIIEMTTNNACFWTIRLKENGSAIGVVGYLGNFGIPGMGYILRPEYWRQGFMTEAIQPALRYGFTHLDLDRVELWIHQENLASQKLAEKAGFTRRGHFRMRYNHQPASHDMLVYGLYRHEWDPKYPVPALQCQTAQPVLSVADVKATAEYYRDMLGFNIDFYYGDPPLHASISSAEWSCEGARIQINHDPDLQSGSAPQSIYIFTGPDIGARYALYRSRGVEIVRTLESKPWGLQEFDIRDCNGCILRFGTPG